MTLTDEAFFGANNVYDMVDKSVNEELRAMHREERRYAALCRRVPSRCTVTYVEGQYSFIQYYKNAESICIPFYENLRGEIHISHILGKDFDLPGDFVEIEVGKKVDGMSCWVIVDLSKRCSENTLYQLFIEAGCVFNHELSEKKIKTALREALLPKLKSCTDMTEVKLLAGMDENFFFHDSVSACALCRHFPNREVPLAEKKLEYVSPTQEHYSGLLNDLHVQLKDWRKSVIILGFLILALFKTPIEAFSRPLNIFLNLIPEDNLPGEWIAQWLQIFNRSQGLGVASGTENSSKMMDRLQKAGGEVIIYDNRRRTDESSYDKKKRCRAESTLRDYVENGTLLSNGRKFGAVLALLSDGYITGKYVINLPLPDSELWNPELHERTLAHKCFEGTVCGFTHAAAERRAEIRSIIVKQRERTADPRVPLLMTAIDLLDFLYGNAGIDWRSAVEAPAEIDVRSLYEDELDSEEELMERFVCLLRDNAHNYVGYEKRRGTSFDKSGFYYSEDWIYIPCAILRSFYVRKHREDQMHRTLRVLLNNGYLLEGDSGRLYCKMQTAEKRKNYYVIKRSFLTPVGTVEFVDLLKEDDHVKK